MEGNLSGVEFIYEDNLYTYQLNTVSDAKEGQPTTCHPITKPYSEGRGHQSNRSFCPPRTAGGHLVKLGTSHLSGSGPNTLEEICEKNGDTNLDNLPLDLTPGGKHLLGMRNLQLTPKGTNMARLNNNLKRKDVSSGLGPPAKRLSFPEKSTNPGSSQKKQLKVHLPQKPPTADKLVDPASKSAKGEKKKAECKLCPLKMPSDQLSDHMSDYHKISKKVCLLEPGHDMKKNKEYILQCYHCREIYQSEKKVRDCRLSHGPHKCSHCQVVKSDEYDLFQHQVDVHKMQIKFLCKIENCGEERTSKRGLMQHQRRVHRIATQKNAIGKIPKDCKDCHKTFCSAQSLSRHQERAAAKPSVCKSTGSDDEDEVDYDDFSGDESEEDEDEVLVQEDVQKEDFLMTFSSQKSDEGMVY